MLRFLTAGESHGTGLEGPPAGPRRAGVRHGRTLAVVVGTTERVRSDTWHREMSPAPGETNQTLTHPWPGHTGAPTPSRR